MALNSPIKTHPSTQPQTPASVSKESVSLLTFRPPEAPSTDADVARIPTYSGWFLWDTVHECEKRFLPEFFDSRSPSKNSKVYMYYRNSIMKLFRVNPSRKLTYTEARKVVVGDVGSIRRVFDFLDAWGLINYTGAMIKQPLKWEEKDSKSNGAPLQGSEPTRRWCSGCKSLCIIACFACDKYELTLCARCYVRRNYQVGVIPSDFRRVEISEETKSDWTEKESLHLLEAILHYGDDWKRVAEHVGGRSEKECVARFIKLPFGETYNEFNHKDASPSKRMCLTPLADASNPIMAQAAFLASLVGVEVAEAAARAAVTALSDVNYKNHSTGKENENDDDVLERAYGDAEDQLEKELLDVEKAISGITDVEMYEMKEKIIEFEDLDVQMEKEWQQLQQLKDSLFTHRINLFVQNHNITTTTTTTGAASASKVGTEEDDDDGDDE